MLMGTIAIAGIPPFSGFFSKDEILAHAFAISPTIWFIGVAGALMTAFYMFRMFYLTFHGEFRGTDKQLNHLHESPLIMTLPLIILAILSVIGGFVGVPEVLGGSHELGEFLSPVFAASASLVPHHHLSHVMEYALMAASVIGVLISIAVAYFTYVSRATIPASDSAPREGIAKASYNKFYVDELYDTLFKRPLDSLSQIFYKVFDNAFIDGIVNGFGQLTRWSAAQFSLIQTGNVGGYLFMMVAGIILILVLNLLIF
jgi:NADH-quinone oxidoreductase subunit L